MFRWFQETVSCAPVGSVFVSLYQCLWLWLCGVSVWCQCVWLCGASKKPSPALLSCHTWEGLFFSVSGCVLCDACDRLLSADV